MASDGNRAATSDQRSTFRGFYLNESPVVSTLRPRTRSPSFSMASSNDPPEVPSGPRCWHEDIIHLLGDLEGVKLFEKYLERQQLRHYYEFYYLCDGFKNMVKESAPQAKLLKILKLAYERYIKKGQALQLESLDENVRTAIGEKMGQDTIDITIFDAAQQQVLDFMRHTSYKSFLESDAYLKSDIYLDFVDYMQHDNSAEIWRRKRKAAPITNKEEHNKVSQSLNKVSIHHDHLARNEHSRFFAEVERALTEGDSLEVASPVKNAAISGAQHRRSQNYDQDEEKWQDTLMPQSSPPKGKKEQEANKIPTKFSATREKIKETAHKQHQPSRIHVQGSDQSIRSDCKHRTCPPKERGDDTAADLEGWDFGPKMSTAMILKHQKIQNNTYKQHQSAQSHDLEYSDQSILDDHCSKVFDNSPSPPRDRKKEKTKDSMSLGGDLNKSQAAYKIPSWQEYSSTGAATNAHARWHPNAKSDFSINSMGDSGVGHTPHEYASLTYRSASSLTSRKMPQDYSSAGAATNANARWLPNAKSTFSLNSRGDSGIGYTTEEYASITYQSASSLAAAASQGMPQHASTLARSWQQQRQQQQRIPDLQAMTNQRSAATLPRSMDRSAELASQHPSTTSNHVSKPSGHWNWNSRGGDQQSRHKQGMQTPHQGDTVALRLIYSFPDDKKVTPYLVGLDLPRAYHLTLQEIKKQCPRKGQLYRYFFKTVIHGMEMLKEECSNAAPVPMLDGCSIFIECRPSTVGVLAQL